jgi:tRNA(Ile)-lysidine synthase
LRRSHPPTLLTLTRAIFRDERLVQRGMRILVAVSGGPDSMALLHVLARLRAASGFEVVAHGVDHGLRASATGELDLAERFARGLDVPFARTIVAVAAGGNLQARARDARHAALRTAATATGCDRIATAHHMNDRAETLLLRLLRGAGPAGLAVLPPRAGVLIRPFLRADRAAIDAHIRRHDVPFAVDPSNRDPRFLRARVRHELMPLLTELSPRIVEHLCALATQLDHENAANPRSTPSLPRATRLALAALVERRSSNGEVLLPGGLVATYDRKQADGGGIVVSDPVVSAPGQSGQSDRMRWKHPPRDGRHHR